MSYEKQVYAKRVVPNLLALWKQEVLRLGVVLEFHPSFDPSSWGGGYLPCKLSVATLDPDLAQQYGPEPVCAGFEFYSLLDRDETAEVVGAYLDEMKREGNPLPWKLRRFLKRSAGMFSFVHGGFTWNAAEFRACWYAAAALARATEGIVFDEWSNGTNRGYLDAEAASRAAAARATEYEYDPKMRERAWALEKFQRWEQ